MEFSEIVQFIIQGVFIAIGTALGTYLANKAVITHIDRLGNILKSRRGQKRR